MNGQALNRNGYNPYKCIVCTQVPIFKLQVSKGQQSKSKARETEIPIGPVNLILGILGARVVIISRK